jgi:microcin C transport system substrate-binding protein
MKTSPSAVLRLQPAHLLLFAFKATLLTCIIFLAACSDSEDTRFPPYDNTAEVEAEWKSKPELYQFKTLADLPADLKWQTGLDEPEIGDPAAKKGGTFNYDMPNFPPTLRFIGPEGSNTFRSEHYDNIEMATLARHPNTDRWIPCIAKEWAISTDRKTAFYKIDPDASYSDGVKVKTEDFFMNFYVSMSKHAKDPFKADYFPKEFKSITKYDDLTFSITMTKVNPDPLLIAAMNPLPRHFFREFTDDFPARYQWRKMPTTGAYDILPEDVKLGRSISLNRVKSWWAKDKKYYRYRFNADRLVYRMVSTMDKAFELFRQGKIDHFSSSAQLLPPNFWYDRGDVPELLNGYIERYSFYNQYPRIPRCLFINQSRPLLDQLDIREGLHHAFDIEKVISVVLRDDAVRMQSAFSGFGRFTNPKLKARAYNPAKAREFFTKAGFTKAGQDGVLMNADGKRLNFTLSLGNMPLYSQAGLIWKEGALKAGVDLQIESLDFTQLFKKGAEKKHDLILAGFGATPPYPEFWQFYHSDNAYEKAADGSRKPKVDTNNFTQTADPELDKIIDQQREAPNEDEMQRLSWILEEKAQQQASEIPTWEVPLFRYFHWRWLRWPKDGNCKYTREALDSFVWWIDDDIKAETLEAMREGRSFGEMSRVFDQYQNKP